ncbi:unnamed protein product [Larinioides sclopetarius]|uniref:Fe2OG dioxygenase domain-containing protein n=1 Tax=Larinioides sclopetarius TaxID=280406 RepID=A0AAV2AR71_9ARAC
MVIDCLKTFSVMKNEILEGLTTVNSIFKFDFSNKASYADISKMPNTVLEIKEKVEAILRQYDLKVKLNSVLLNLYRNEKDSVAWHSDDELSLGICPTIASVSLGTTRKFEMRPKENVRDYGAKDIIYVNLTHGSLIVMDGVMQQDWQCLHIQSMQAYDLLQHTVL